MPETYIGYRFFLLAVILILNGFFAAAEVSLLSTRRSKLRSLAEAGNVGAQAAVNLLQNPERLLSVTQLGVTLASLGLGWAGEDTLFQLLSRLFSPIVTPATAMSARDPARTSHQARHQPGDTSGRPSGSNPRLANARVNSSLNA